MILLFFLLLMLALAWGVADHLSGQVTPSPPPAAVVQPAPVTIPTLGEPVTHSDEPIPPVATTTDDGGGGSGTRAAPSPGD